MNTAHRIHDLDMGRCAMEWMDSSMWCYQSQVPPKSSIVSAGSISRKELTCKRHSKNLTTKKYAHCFDFDHQAHYDMYL